MMHGFGFGGFGTLGWIGMILNLIITIGVIVGIVLLVVWLLRRMGSQDPSGYQTHGGTGNLPSPKEIVQARYARGEIGREEYQQLLSDLG